MLKVELISLEKLVATAEGVEVLLPGLEGQLGIRTGHLPLTTPLKHGEVVIKHKDGSEKVFAVYGGFVEVFHDTVRIMSDSAEDAADLDELAVQEAITRATQQKDTIQNDVDIAATMAGISKDMAKIKAIRRQKRSKNGQTKL